MSISSHLVVFILSCILSTPWMGFCTPFWSKMAFVLTCHNQSSHSYQTSLCQALLWTCFTHKRLLNHCNNDLALIPIEMWAKIDKFRSSLMNDNKFQWLNNVWKKIKCKKWHNELSRFIQWWLRPLYCVVSYLYYLKGALKVLQ